MEMPTYLQDVILRKILSHQLNESCYQINNHSDQCEHGCLVLYHQHLYQLGSPAIILLGQWALLS